MCYKLLLLHVISVSLNHRFVCKSPLVIYSLLFLVFSCKGFPSERMDLYISYNFQTTLLSVHIIPISSHGIFFTGFYIEIPSFDTPPIGYSI
jgi:hypothetical protein